MKMYHHKHISEIHVILGALQRIELANKFHTEIVRHHENKLVYSFDFDARIISLTRNTRSSTANGIWMTFQCQIKPSTDAYCSVLPGRTVSRTVVAL